MRRNECLIQACKPVAISVEVNVLLTYPYRAEGLPAILLGCFPTHTDAEHINETMRTTDGRQSIAFQW